MKKRLIHTDETYIRKFLIKNYKRIHRYNVKSLITFLVTGLSTLFLFIYLFPSVFKSSTTAVLIVKIVCEVVFAFYTYFSLTIFVRNRKDFFATSLKEYKKKNIYVFETELKSVEFANGAENDLGYVDGPDGEETYGILFSLDEIDKNKKKCFLVFDPVMHDIRYVIPIRKDNKDIEEDEDDEDEE